MRSDPAALAIFLDRWHFTATQTHELRRLLRRWEIAQRDDPPLDRASDARNGREALNLLRREILASFPALETP